MSAATASELLDMLPRGDARHYAFGVLAAVLARDGQITVETWQSAMRDAEIAAAR